MNAIRHISADIAWKFSGNSQEGFAGNFEMKGWNDTGILTELDDFDKDWCRNVPVKDNERIFRYRTDRTMLANMKPLIKINVVSGLVYFLTEKANEEDIVEFETRGTRAQFINLLEK